MNHVRKTCGKQPLNPKEYPPSTHSHCTNPLKLTSFFFMHARCHVFAFEHPRAKESPTHHFGPQPVPSLPFSLFFAKISRPPTLLFSLSISCLIHLMLRFDRGGPQSREASKLSQASDSPILRNRQLLVLDPVAMILHLDARFTISTILRTHTSSCMSSFITQQQPAPVISSTLIILPSSVFSA